MAKLKPKSVLQEADAIVNGPRQDAYGSPADNFCRWRDLCRSTGRPGLENVTAEDLAITMVLLKIARDTASPKRDNAVDGAGYFDILDQVRGL